MRFENVIIGGGLAGGMVAQEYREQGGDGSVLIVAREVHVPYHRPPLTKEFLRGEKPLAEVYMHPEDWWKEHDVEVRTGTEATGLDTGSHTVILSDGDTVEYGRLALATGATPRTLPGTSSIRTIEDSQALAKRLEGEFGHLGVIGGGDFTARPVLASYDANTINAATYAITVEQAGGSPSGKPTAKASPTPYRCRITVESADSPFSSDSRKT